MIKATVLGQLLQLLRFNISGVFSDQNCSKTPNSTGLEYRSNSPDFSFQSNYDQKQVLEDLAVSKFH